MNAKTLLKTDGIVGIAGGIVSLLLTLLTLLTLFSLGIVSEAGVYIITVVAIAMRVMFLVFGCITLAQRKKHPGIKISVGVLLTVEFLGLAGICAIIGGSLALANIKHLDQEV